MLITRIRRINTYFRARICEWLFTAILFAWGWVLLLPYDTFALPSLAGMSRVATETQWGIGCLAVAVLRLAVLVINGSWRRSAHGRMLCAIVSCFAWFNISLGLMTTALSTGILAPGFVIYPVILAFELYVVFIAAGDARETDEALRNGQP